MMPRRRALAFTLLELLVVISIIALLASMLIPVIGMVRSSSRGLKCLSNQRQLGFYTAQFMELNEGYYPGYAHTASGSISWFTILSQEVMAGDSVGVAQFGSSRSLNCPEFKQSATSYKRPYSLNSDICRNYALQLATPHEKNPSYTLYYFGIHNALIRHPSTKVLFQDSEDNAGEMIEVWPSYETNPVTCWSFYPSSVGCGMIANGGQCAFRHSGAMPSVYVDLHCDMTMPNKLLNSSKRYRYDQ